MSTAIKLSGKVAKNGSGTAAVQALKREVLLLRQRVARLEAAAPVCVPVETFGPEPYVVLKPFHAVVEAADDEYVATFYDANLSASGATQEEAMSNLKDYLLLVFETLTEHDPEQLGQEPTRQLHVLKEFAARRR